MQRLDVELRDRGQGIDNVAQDADGGRGVVVPKTGVDGVRDAGLELGVRGVNPINYGTGLYV